MKNQALKFIDSIPLLFALFFGIGLGLAPFVPEPHLIEKSRMLWEGTLTKPLDIFDLLMHAVPVILLALKLWRITWLKQHGPRD